MQTVDLLTWKKGRTCLLEEKKVREWHLLTIPKICNLHVVEHKSFIDKRRVHFCDLYWLSVISTNPQRCFIWANLCIEDVVQIIIRSHHIKILEIEVYESIDLLSTEVLNCRLLNYNQPTKVIFENMASFFKIFDNKMLKNDF